MSGLEGGIRNRAVMYLAGCLPYLWRSVKHEDIYLKDYQTVPEVRKGLADYLHHYNCERYHQSLDYQTPFSVYSRKQ
jgi:transposase InsO family protein